MGFDSYPVCLCLTGKSLAEDLSILERYRGKVDLAELRVDCLDHAERFLIRSFPAKAGIPCLLTVRRKSDGGFFEDGEGVRLVMIAKALSYASSDARANFAYADLESDFRMPAIEEACRTFGTRIIRSRNFIQGMPEDLDKVWASLTQEEDEIPKLAVCPKGAGDLAALLAWAARLPKRERIVIGTGEYGFATRILASRLGSLFTYTSPVEEGLSLAAPGQTTPEKFLDVYRGKETGPGSDLYVLLGGKSILGSLSPEIHNTAFRCRGKDAVLAPLPSESIETALEAMRILGAKGAAITVPHKEAVLPYLFFHSTDVQKIGACNTILWRDGGWAGYNTDADGFERSALEFLGRKDFSGIKATLVGAGGAAKSLALSLYRSGGQCLILNRTVSTARALAKKYGFAWGHLDDRSIDEMARYSDLIVQATSMGMDGGPQGDPLDFYEFSGREKVFDLIYRPDKTAFLARAEAAGCSICNGYKMLRYQAAGQYRRWMGEEPPNEYY